MGLANITDKRIDTYLTNFARAYRLGANLGNWIAPSFKVEKPSDKYLIYGKQVARVYDNKISGRSKAKEIDVQASDSSYSCEEYSLAAFVSDRSLRNTQQPIKVKEKKTQWVKNAQILAREKRVWDIAGSTSIVTNYSDLSHAWDTASSATPVTNIFTALQSINDNTGETANAIAMSYKVALKMIATTEWKGYFQYTWGNSNDGDGMFSAIKGLQHFGLEAQLTGAHGTSTYEIGTSDPSWELMFGDKVLIFKRDATPTLESMCFMYSPFTVIDQIESYRVPGERGERFEIYEEIDELLINADCAYLLTEVIA